MKSSKSFDNLATWLAATLACVKSNYDLLFMSGSHTSFFPVTNNNNEGGLTEATHVLLHIYSGHKLLASVLTCSSFHSMPWLTELKTSTNF